MNGSEAPPSQALQPTAGAPAPVTSCAKLSLEQGCRPTVFSVKLGDKHLGTLSFDLIQGDRKLIKLSIPKGKKCAVIKIGEWNRNVSDEEMLLKIPKIVSAFQKLEFAALAPESSGHESAVKSEEMIKSMQGAAAKIILQPISPEEKVAEQAQSPAAETRSKKRRRNTADAPATAATELPTSVLATTFMPQPLLPGNGASSDFSHSVLPQIPAGACSFGYRLDLPALDFPSPPVLPFAAASVLPLVPSERALPSTPTDSIASPLANLVALAPQQIPDFLL